MLQAGTSWGTSSLRLWMRYIWGFGLFVFFRRFGINRVGGLLGNWSAASRRNSRFRFGEIIKIKEKNASCISGRFSLFQPARGRSRSERGNNVHSLLRGSCVLFVAPLKITDLRSTFSYDKRQVFSHCSPARRLVKHTKAIVDVERSKSGSPGNLYCKLLFPTRELSPIPRSACTVGFSQLDARLSDK